MSLCESCVYLREVRTARSRFVLCTLSAERAEFPKYPRQPVEHCTGYQRREPTDPDQSDTPSDRET